MRKVLSLGLLLAIWIVLLFDVLYAGAPVQIHILDTCACSQLEIRKVGQDFTITFVKGDSQPESIKLKRDMDYIIMWLPTPAD